MLNLFKNRKQLLSGITVYIICLIIMTIAAGIIYSDEPESMVITWQDAVINYRSHVGETFEFVCPENGTPSTVWGTGIYTDDSSVCTAAVHAGLIDFEKGGTVLIEIREGIYSYSGSTINGVTTYDWGSWYGSFVFPESNIEYSMDAGNWASTAIIYRGNIDEQYEINCPPNGTPHTIWGTDVYSDDSSICTAAVHAGIITLEAGGKVIYQIKGGLDSYEGSEQNGITSQNWDEWYGSFIFP